MAAIPAAYRARVAAALAQLGIDPRDLVARKLKLHAEASRLAHVGIGTDGRDKFLAPGAAAAWRKMSASARKQGVQLLLVSAFRSVDFQVVLIRGKLERGAAIADVLKVNAPPGYSEHHTGRALDIGVDGCPPLDEAFEKTAAFGWLQKHSKRFGFTMSYPRGNAQGYLYEPWHWCYIGKPSAIGQRQPSSRR